MSTSDRGLKHIFPECETKCYDPRKEIINCPRCGAKPLPAKVRKAAQPARKSGRTVFERFPLPVTVQPKNDLPGPVLR